MLLKITISGLSPLLMNRFTDENGLQISMGVSHVHVGSKPSPREQAAKKAYADEDGNLFLPGPNIYAALIQAGTFHKSGKSKVTTARTSLVPAGIFMLDAVVPLGTKKYEIDSRSVVIPATGGRIMCHRPRLDMWSATFNLDIDESMFSEQFVRTLVDDAGRKIGLGDFRPARKGPFGRFNVTAWKSYPNPI